ncbi:hypothetical protein BKA64DRAFT_460635 [Cadophora sp. MPI-SDFR-AT-0126]|nr:hypothetical protein BKA64DRAFT_460635 [Leotiomycetes sp. MPI-SDFR-AT-0126]
MVALFLLIALSILGQIAHGWGYHESCKSIESELKAAMLVVFRRAKDASKAIETLPRNQNIEVLIKLLFGEDQNTIEDARVRLESIQFMDVFNSNRPDPYDVIIYCTTDRITDTKDKKGVRDGYRDPDRKNDVEGFANMDNCRDENHQGDASTRALTINKGKKTENGKPTREVDPDTIQLCPWFLKQIAGPPPTYEVTDDLVKKAAAMKAKSLLKKFVSKLSNEVATPVDSLAGFEHVLLHEMMHSATALYADDKPDKRCYGWKHCGKCKRSDNADSLAYFALAVELAYYRSYTVNKDGTLQKIA